MSKYDTSRSLDILAAWTHLQPDNIKDIRQKLPRGSSWPGKRALEEIQGLCVHQIAGNDNPYNTAEYHVKHFMGTGAPGLCYTFYLSRDGTIWWCNNIEDVVWSQGWAGRPGSENVDFLSIVCGGDFSGPGYVGRNEPTLNEMLSLLSLIRWLCFHLELDYDDILGHDDLGKPNCPGTVLSTVVNALNKDSTNGSVEWDVMTWQCNLVRLGYDLGKFGPNRDGCDGDWGGVSKAALLAFQASAGMIITGFRDKLTKKKIIHALREKFGNSVVVS